MNVVYDLRHSPASYDVVAFILAAEQRRLHLGQDKIGTFYVFPGEVNGFRRDKFWPHDVEQRIKLRDKVVLPMIRMLPSVDYAAVLDHRMPGLVNPFGLASPRYGLKVQVDCMREGIRPLRADPKLPKKGDLVTITLRECDHWPERNSNFNEWFHAADQIQKMGFKIAIIRDENKHQYSEWSVASRELWIRGALYEAAACNMFVSNGPAWFALALDVPVLMLKPTTENLMSTCSAAYFDRCGIPPGGQIPGSPVYQRLVWREDTRENIVSAFREYMELQK